MSPSAAFAEREGVTAAIGETNAAIAVALLIMADFSFFDDIMLSHFFHKFYAYNMFDYDYTGFEMKFGNKTVTERLQYSKNELFIYIFVVMHKKFYQNCAQ